MTNAQEPSDLTISIRRYVLGLAGFQMFADHVMEQREVPIR